MPETYATSNANSMMQSFDTGFAQMSQRLDETRKVLQDRSDRQQMQVIGQEFDNATKDAQANLMKATAAQKLADEQLGGRALVMLQKGDGGKDRVVANPGEGYNADGTVNVDAGYRQDFVKQPPPMIRVMNQDGSVSTQVPAAYKGREADYEADTDRYKQLSGVADAAHSAAIDAVMGPTGVIQTKYDAVMKMLTKYGSNPYAQQ